MVAAASATTGRAKQGKWKLVENKLCTWQTRHFTLNISIGETCLHEAYIEVCGLARFFAYVLAFLQHCVVPGRMGRVLDRNILRNFVTFWALRKVFYVLLAVSLGVGSESTWLQKSSSSLDFLRACVLHFLLCYVSLYKAKFDASPRCYT
eukprot:4825131-Amphidinium_carterae.1